MFGKCSVLFRYTSSILILSRLKDSKSSEVNIFVVNPSRIAGEDGVGLLLPEKLRLMVRSLVMQ